MSDAISFISSLSTGDKFKVRGKTYAYAGGSGSTYSSDRRGEYVKFKVFGAGGKQPFITVHADDKVERSTAASVDELPWTHR